MMCITVVCVGIRLVDIVVSFVVVIMVGNGGLRVGIQTMIIAASFVLILMMSRVGIMVMGIGISCVAIHSVSNWLFVCWYRYYEYCCFVCWGSANVYYCFVGWKNGS